MMKKRPLSTLFVGCLLALFLTVPAICQNTYSFVWAWGSPGTGPYQLWSPLGLAIDSAGNVYISDNVNQRIQILDSNGNFLRRFGEVGFGDDQFYYPSGIAIDSHDNIYVVQNQSDRAQKFDSSGHFLMKWDIPGRPVGVAVDSEDNAYVVSSDTNTIFKLNPDNTTSDWGGGKSEEGQLHHPHGIAFDRFGNFFVTQEATNEVKKYDKNGVFMKLWGGSGTEDGKFNFPLFVAVDSVGNVYVTDSWNSRVQKFDANGNFLCKWGQYGTGDGQFLQAGGIAVDKNGNVYVTDMSNWNLAARVEKFSPPHIAYTFEGFFPPIENPPTVNTANAGQAIPVKWRITDKNGLAISDSASFISITSYGVNCATFEGDPTNSVEEFAAGSSGLQYLGDGWWQFNWKTPKTYKGQCRTMKLTLDDKSEHTASFHFK